MYRLDGTEWTAFEPSVDTMADRGFLLGDGVFETFRIENGRIRNDELHASALSESCTALDLTMPDWATVTAAIGAHADSGNRVGKLIVTRGPAPRGLTPVAEPRPQAFLQLSERPEPPAQVRLASVPIRRSATSLAARYKTLSYADNLAARRLAVAAGADMALITADDGRLSGGDSANLFWLAGDTVQTPSLSCGARNGVMRQRVLAWLEARNVDVEEVEAAPTALLSADAVWMTNAVAGVMPVVTIDGRALEHDHPLLAELMAADL
ncbi:aminotransferase class IV [Hyphobacterium sp.]|uniref:aminotransferase class IV n=1 Tax=Hyphobacterium sp. TaxID=2004662 RepID=UPI003B51F6B6